MIFARGDDGSVFRRVVVFLAVGGFLVVVGTVVVLLLQASSGSAPSVSGVPTASSPVAGTIQGPNGIEAPDPEEVRNAKHLQDWVAGRVSHPYPPDDVFVQPVRFGQYRRPGPAREFGSEYVVVSEWSVSSSSRGTKVVSGYVEDDRGTGFIGVFRDSYVDLTQVPHAVTIPRVGRVTLVAGPKGRSAATTGQTEGQFRFKTSFGAFGTFFLIDDSFKLVD